MTKQRLRAVNPDETPVQPPPVTLAEAVETGDELLIALAQRRDIVRKLEDASGPAAAALHRQLTMTSEKITELEQARMVEADVERDRTPKPHDRFDASAI